MRNVEVDSLVNRAVARAPPNAPLDANELRRQANRDPAGFATRQLQVEKQGPLAAIKDAVTYDEAEARAKDIQALVRSIFEVQELFTSITTLVSHQAEAIDTIESHVEQAGLQVTKANTQLESAIKKRRRRRKCYCCLAIAAAVLLVFAIIALSLFVTGAYKALIP